MRVSKFWKWQSFAKFIFYPSVFIILLQLKYAATWQNPATKISETKFRWKWTIINFTSSTWTFPSPSYLCTWDQSQVSEGQYWLPVLYLLFSRPRQEASDGVAVPGPHRVRRPHDPQHPVHPVGRKAGLQLSSNDLKVFPSGIFKMSTFSPNKNPMKGVMTNFFNF